MLSSPIRDSKIIHFARTDEIIQTIHELRNRCVVIPPVDIEEVDVASPQILQGVLKSQTKTLGDVATKVRLDLDVFLVLAVCARVFGCNNEVVAVAPALPPLSQPLL